MYDDETAAVVDTTVFTTIRLDAAERLLPELAALADEVRALRWSLVPPDGITSWRSAASAIYVERLAIVRDMVQEGADEIERAHEALAHRIALMQRAVEARAQAGAWRTGS